MNNDTVYSDQTGYTDARDQNSDMGTNPACGADVGCGCGKKMMLACKDLCQRFLDSRVVISYQMTTRICKASEVGQEATSPSKGKGETGETYSANGHTMDKKGRCVLRPLDMVVGSLLVCSVMSLMTAMKCLCRCK